MKKRVFSLSLAIVLAVSMLLLPSFAASSEIKLVVNGQNYTFDKSLGTPFINDDSRTLVPLRSAAYALGLSEEDVQWDQENQTVSLSHDDKTVIFTVGSNRSTITQDGKTSYMLMDTAPVLSEGRTYLPIRYLAAAIGYSTAWDNATSTISLTSIAEGFPIVTVYLTRHGKTMFNTVGRVQGWCDTPLTEAGAKVAADLGKGLNASGITFIAAYSSDLGRQRETARLVLDQLGLNNMQITELFGLRETCFGSWEGELESVRDEAYCEITGMHSIYEIYEAGGSLFNDITIQTDTTNQAESLEQVQSRMLEALTQIAQEGMAAGGGNVLAVSSGGITTSLIEIFSGTGANIKNASVTILTYVDGVFILGSVGDTSYSELGATID